MRCNFHAFFEVGGLEVRVADQRGEMVYLAKDEMKFRAIKFVEVRGFEPLTFSLRTRRSTN